MNRIQHPRRLFAGAALLLGLGGIGLGLTSPSGPAVRSATETLRADSLDPTARERLLLDLSVLSHDSMEGRRTGTAGNERARHFLRAEFERRGLSPLAEGFAHPFAFTPPGADPVEAVNLLGVVRGTEFPERTIVLSAHYDHLGVRGGEIFNGADDNASGTAALLAVLDRLVAVPPRHTVLIAAFDAEEMGLRGAREFIAAPPVPLDSILLNLNLDMVSRSDRGELYVAGTHHSPFLTPLVVEVAGEVGVTLLRGHDTPDLPAGDDWTLASDHGPFHEAGIPFLYLGVEDHPGYHAPSDTFENITPEFFVEAVETVLLLLRRVDAADLGILRSRTGVP